MMYKFNAQNTQWRNPDPQAAKARATRTNSRGRGKMMLKRASVYRKMFTYEYIVCYS